MTENQNLRGLLRTLATFIGDGAGGLLPKMGWTMQDFNEYVNKGETDTAWESYQQRKKTHRNSGDDQNSGFSTKTTGQKRSADSESNTSSSKRPRNDDKEIENRNGFSMLMPMSASMPSPATPLYSAGPQQTQNGIFPPIMRNSNNSPLFMSGSPSNAHYSGPSPGMDNYSRPYLPAVNMGIDQSPHMYDSPGSAPTTAVSHQRVASNGNAEAQEDTEEEEDPKKSEAFKLIK